MTHSEALTKNSRTLRGEASQKAQNRMNRVRNPGRLARKGRVDELRSLLRYAVVKEHPHLALESPETKRRADEQAAEWLKRYDRLESFAAHYTPVHYTPRGNRAREVIVHSVLCVPQVAYVLAALRHRTGQGAKATGGLQMQIGIFAWMAFSQEEANVTQAIHGLRGHAKRAWALHYPRLGAEYKALLKSMRGCLRRNDPDLIKHAMVDLAKEAYKALDDRGRPETPGAMRYLATDGFLVKSNVEQRQGVDDADKQRMRKKRRNIGYVIYTSLRSFQQDQTDLGGDDHPSRNSPPEGGTRASSRRGSSTGGRRRQAEGRALQMIRKCHGNKVVSLHCVRLNQPVIADVFPAEVNEREAVLCLLEDLFLLWPDAPVYALLGDSLFDSETFCFELVFSWGIQPVFAKGKEYGADNAWIAHSKDTSRRGRNGVPCCSHGLMRFLRKADYWDADKRAAAGIPRGDLAPTLAFRIRWQCAVGRCPEQSTYPRENARLFTLYPQLGLDDLLAMDKVLHREELRRWHDDCLAADAAGTPRVPKPVRPTPTRAHGEYPAARILLQASANAIESSWSLMAGGFQGNHGPLRAAWVQEDRDMEWLLMTAVLGIAARRTVFRKGLYDKSEAEAKRLDLLRIPTAEDPAPGPTAEQVDEAGAARPVLPKRPETWHGPDFSAAGAKRREGQT